MKVFKYVIPRKRNEYGACEIEMPSGAQILSTAVVNDEIVIYAKVFREDDALVIKSVYILGTGKEMPNEQVSNWEFLGTVIQGPFVWHVFI